jgi:hypothetical protein
MKVKNINGRRQKSCSCGSWLDHWAKVSGWPVPEYCSVSTCMTKPQFGIHVQRDSLTDTNWYIIPFCIKHSIRAVSLEVANTTPLVSADVNDTCAQQMPAGNVWPHELKGALATGAFETESDTTAMHAMDIARRFTPGLYGKEKPARREPPTLRANY